MVAMTVASTDFHPDRPLTADDLALIQDDGHRYELDDGVLVMFPAPTFIHQVVVSRMTAMLAARAPRGLLVVAGPGVEISPIHYRVPDIVVVRVSDVDFDDKPVTKPPLLAIEVASPSTTAYDRNRKKDVYAQFGIASYWIVSPHPHQPNVTAFELRRGDYKLVAHASGDETFRPERPFACEIIPATLVARQ